MIICFDLSGFLQGLGQGFGVLQVCIITDILIGECLSMGVRLTYPDEVRSIVGALPGRRSGVIASGCSPWACSSSVSIFLVNIGMSREGFQLGESWDSWEFVVNSSALFLK